ncbi:hypothetical protein Y1Q_0006555 [Alligator mississippiensis]|uniref:Uncharacterized protein n=1 Tax=Alligator mississippiensis TaxID=8496 RepID=A0A151NTX8_ALLMI|nr:hypothetical protein Y1Q_0006555 [Alligator mississippiensis]
MASHQPEVWPQPGHHLYMHYITGSETCSSNSPPCALFVVIHPGSKLHLHFFELHLCSYKTFGFLETHLYSRIVLVREHLLPGQLLCCAASHPTVPGLGVHEALR